MKYDETFYADSFAAIDAQLSANQKATAKYHGLDLRAMTDIVCGSYAVTRQLRSTRDYTKQQVVAELKRKAKVYLQAQANSRFPNRLYRATYGSIWIMLAMAIFSEIIKILIARWWDS